VLVGLLDDVPDDLASIPSRPEPGRGRRAFRRGANEGRRKSASLRGRNVTRVPSRPGNLVGFPVRRWCRQGGIMPKGKEKPKSNNKPKVSIKDKQKKKKEKAAATK
jgi:hypothetical protein